MLAAGAIAILTIVVAVVALLQVPTVATWAVNRLVTLVPLSPGHSLEVGGVGGNWLTGLRLRDVVLEHWTWERSIARFSAAVDRARPRKSRRGGDRP